MSVLQESLYFGFVISLAAYLIGCWLKKKVGWAILNPLLVAVVIVIAVLQSPERTNHEVYQRVSDHLWHYDDRRIFKQAFAAAGSSWCIRTVSTLTFALHKSDETGRH